MLTFLPRFLIVEDGGSKVGPEGTYFLLVLVEQMMNEGSCCIWSSVCKWVMVGGAGGILYSSVLYYGFLFYDSAMQFFKCLRLL